jgi:hypothetical protein
LFEEKSKSTLLTLKFNGGWRLHACTYLKKHSDKCHARHAEPFSRLNVKCYVLMNPNSLLFHKSASEDLRPAYATPGGFVVSSGYTIIGKLKKFGEVYRYDALSKTCSTFDTHEAAEAQSSPHLLRRILLRYCGIL